MFPVQRSTSGILAGEYCGVHTQADTTAAFINTTS